MPLSLFIHYVKSAPCVHHGRPRNNDGLAPVGSALSLVSSFLNSPDPTLSLGSAPAPWGSRARGGRRRGGQCDHTGHRSRLRHHHVGCRGFHQIPTFPGKKTSYTGSGTPGGRQARPALPSGRSGPWLDLPAPPEPHPLPAPLPVRSRPALHPNVPEPRPSSPPPPPPRASPLPGREEPPRPRRSLHRGRPPLRAPRAPPGGHGGEAAANQTGLPPPCGSAPCLVRHVAPGAWEVPGEGQEPGEVLGWQRGVATSPAPRPARHELRGRPAAADTPATPGLPGGRGTGPDSEPLTSPPPGAEGTELGSGRRTPCGHPQPALTEGEAPGCGDPFSAGGRGLLGEEGDRPATCMAVCHRSLRGSSTRSSSPRAQGQFGTLSPGAVYTNSTASYQRAQTQGSISAPLVAQGRGMEAGSSPLTTHVLDTASGLPAQGLCLRLSRLEDHGQQWTELRKR